MATAEGLKQELQRYAKKLDDPVIAEEFEDFNKTMQFIIPDIDCKIQLVFQDKKARVEEGLNENAEMSLEVESDLFLGISTGEVDPMEVAGWSLGGFSGLMRSEFWKGKCWVL